MQQQFKIVEATPSRPGRLAHLGTVVKDAIRSYWSGPLTSRSPELARLWSGTTTTTGVMVNEQTALTIAGVRAAVNLISATVAGLPLPVYRVGRNDSKDRARDLPLYGLLNAQPNPEMTAFVFRQTLTAHALVWGNGYAEIERATDGRPLALWPLTPDRVAPYRSAPGATLQYLVSNPNGGQVAIDAGDVLHIQGLGYDGTRGYSVVSQARESLGLALACEKFGGTFFRNGSSFGGVITYPNDPSDLVKKNNREALQARHEGVQNAHRMLALYGGAKYDTLAGIAPEDAQFLQTRKFQVNEIARWFNIPPHKIGDLERSTYSNIEHQSTEYLTDCLLPWLRRWEQQLEVKCLSAIERPRFAIEHAVEGLLRGDAASRSVFYKTMIDCGAMSVNEVRRLENLNPVEGGDAPRVPSSTTSLTAA